jgi:AAA domain, putative AbiEii toxin, Type IV TA system/AAA ATPase domain
MLSSLQISGYRGLGSLELAGLGRVNLLVGRNNSGKTSVLEAIELLSWKGDPSCFWRVAMRRGERNTLSIPGKTAEEPPRYLVEASIAHLFTGHDVKPGSKFVISGRNDSNHCSLNVEMVQLSNKEVADLQSAPPGARLALKLSGNPPPRTSRFPLSVTQGLRPENVDFTRAPKDRPEPAVQFITTESLSADQLLNLWGKVALQPQEELVLEALRFIDPDIERIAPIPAAGPFFFGGQQRFGFSVKTKSSAQPFPIGSMGDGIWRMLALSIALSLCQDGTLLIDEIDTGLHYTVMTSMWKMICNAAKRFNVQVFATTHSWDCIYSLAQIAYEDTQKEHSVTVQRIESQRKRAVQFTEEELAIVAEREIEVR